MATEKPASWIGASGTAYTFYVFGLQPDVPTRLGNFIYAKRNADGAWVPIYMGHGDLAACCTDSDALRCIAANAATHLHLRLNSRDADRTAEHDDLLAHYANAFAPEGCHEPAAGTARGKATKQAAKKAAPTKAAANKGATKKTATKTAAAKKTAKTASRKAAVKAKPPRPRAR